LSRGQKKQTLRDFTRGNPSKEDDEYFRDAMNAPSDMACAILQAIRIEHELEGCILLRFHRRDQDTIDLLSKDNGSLGTFFAKIGLGYALGIYGADLMEHLNVIRRVRNAFAHSRRKISFASPLIRAELHALRNYPGASETIREYVRLIKSLTRSDMPEVIRGKADMDNTLALTGRAAYSILGLTLSNYFVRDQTSVYRTITASHVSLPDADLPQQEA
jgi:hypothetical protein